MIFVSDEAGKFWGIQIGLRVKTQNFKIWASNLSRTQHNTFLTQRGSTSSSGCSCFKMAPKNVIQHKNIDPVIQKISY